MKILFINAADTSRHVSSANTAIYPNLGILTLMSSLKRGINNPDTELGYLDGTVYGNFFIQRYIEENYQTISVICFSVLTSNYGASILFSNLARSLNQKIITIFGNDHFSALYENIMKNQLDVSYGFYGNDVVEGFTDMVLDIMSNTVRALNSYPGLVYRNEVNEIKRNSENPNEYNRLPLVDYSLSDTLFPHNEYYMKGQEKTYNFIRERGLKGQLIDIGRGCIKFGGPRVGDIPLNACDFCGIIPGSKGIMYKTPDQAWLILKNAYEHGYNYFYVTADELPLTFWRLLNGMANSIPEWYKKIPSKQRPKMFGYARAEGLVTQTEKIDVIIDVLGFDHFFIGFDGLSNISLEVMNKQPLRNSGYDLMRLNMEALEKVVKKGCLITAGLVVTHLGITPEILDDNYQNLEKIVSRYPSTFAALDFGPLCPIPGSMTFRYLIDPEFAKAKAEKHGLLVNVSYLESIRQKYLYQDILDMDELVDDFILGCCPKITSKHVDDHLERIRTLAQKYSIVIGGGV
jgi:hypothetical protein